MYISLYPDEQPINIVFYPHNGKVQELIQILLELFPDNLNISSGLFPRYSFRINNSLYFSIGDTSEKNPIPHTI
jgi:hypothetical protein